MAELSKGRGRAGRALKKGLIMVEVTITSGRYLCFGVFIRNRSAFRVDLAQALDRANPDDILKISRALGRALRQKLGIKVQVPTDRIDLELSPGHEAKIVR